MEGEAEGGDRQDEVTRTHSGLHGGVYLNKAQHISRAMCLDAYQGPEFCTRRPCLGGSKCHPGLT